MIRPERDPGESPGHGSKRFLNTLPRGTS